MSSLLIDSYKKVKVNRKEKVSMAFLFLSGVFFVFALSTEVKYVATHSYHGRNEAEPASPFR